MKNLKDLLSKLWSQRQKSNKQLLLEKLEAANIDRIYFALYYELDPEDESQVKHLLDNFKDKADEFKEAKPKLLIALGSIWKT